MPAAFFSRCEFLVTCQVRRLLCGIAYGGCADFDGMRYDFFLSERAAYRRYFHLLNVDHRASSCAAVAIEPSWSQSEIIVPEISVKRILLFDLDRDGAAISRGRLIEWLTSSCNLHKKKNDLRSEIDEIFAFYKLSFIALIRKKNRHSSKDAVKFSGDANQNIFFLYYIRNCPYFDHSNN